MHALARKPNADAVAQIVEVRARIETGFRCEPLEPEKSAAPASPATGM
jgi:hypothetical protein